MGKVVELTDADLIWGFQDNRQGPGLPTGRYSTTVDPFPCYAHDVKLVRQTLRTAEKAFPVFCKPTVYVLHHETESRTNGWATVEHPWPKDAKYPWYGVIVLPGKRIPPHPAMTRYVTAHEYGHHVEYELLRRRELDAHSEVIADEYAEMRGVKEKPRYYGGRTWHASVAELIANDFRILIAGVEEEFWPHAGFERPEKLPAVRRWWDEQLSA